MPLTYSPCRTHYGARSPVPLQRDTCSNTAFSNERVSCLLIPSLHVTPICRDPGPQSKANSTYTDPHTVKHTSANLGDLPSQPSSDRKTECRDTHTAGCKTWETTLPRPATITRKWRLEKHISRTYRDAAWLCVCVCLCMLERVLPSCPDGTRHGQR